MLRLFSRLPITHDSNTPNEHEYEYLIVLPTPEPLLFTAYFTCLLNHCGSCPTKILHSYRVSIVQVPSSIMVSSHHPFQEQRPRVSKTDLSTTTLFDYLAPRHTCITCSAVENRWTSAGWAPPLPRKASRPLQVDKSTGDEA